MWCVSTCFHMVRSRRRRRPVLSSIWSRNRITDPCNGFEAGRATSRMMNRTCGDEGKWKQKRKTDVWTGTRKKEKDSVEHCAHLTQHAARSIAWLVGVARSRGAPSLCEALWLTTPPCRYSASTVQYLTPCIPSKWAINISFNLNQGQFGLPLHLR